MKLLGQVGLIKPAAIDDARGIAHGGFHDRPAAADPPEAFGEDTRPHGGQLPGLERADRQQAAAVLVAARHRKEQILNGADPEASQRLVIAAKQMLMELQNRQLEGLGDVVDLMNYSGRRLSRADSGDMLRERQDRIVELLDGLIEEAQKQEKSSSSSSSSGGGSSGGQRQSGGAKPSSPLEDSILPGGRGRTGKLGARRRANPGDMWGAMPPAKREQILQALRDNFPRRYRKLVEQYYEELAKKP